MAIRWSTYAIVLGLILPTLASAQQATDSYMQYMLDRHVRAVEFKDFNQASAYMGTRDGVTELKTGTTTAATRTAVTTTATTESEDDTKKSLNFEITAEECESPDRSRSQLSQCISAQIEIESAIVEQNPWNYNSGFERQYGRTLINLKGQYVKPIQNSRIQGFSIEFDVVPRDMVMDYRENPSSNNINRYKNTGYISRPNILGSASAYLDVAGDWDARIRMGVDKTHGLTPLEGRASQHHIVQSLAANEGYNGLMDVTFMKSDAFSLTLGINNSEYTHGNYSVYREGNHRANSWAGVHGGMEMNVTQAFSKVLPEIVRKAGNLYFGATGHYGNSGSLSSPSKIGVKQVQDDLIAYTGYWRELPNGRLELRVYKAQYARNPEGNGSGRHADLVSIDGKGAELSLSRFRAGPCDWSLYATGYKLKNDGRADDHFFPTSKNVNGVATDMSGYAAGLSCNNLKNSNFRIGVQASRQKFDEPWVIGNGQGEGPYEDMSAIMLVFGGKFGARVSK